MPKTTSFSPKLSLYVDNKKHQIFKLFTDLHTTHIFSDLNSLEKLDDLIKTAQAKNYYCTLICQYELTQLFFPEAYPSTLHNTKKLNQPLLELQIYKHCITRPFNELNSALSLSDFSDDLPTCLYEWQFDTTYSEYKTQFQTILDALQKGATYQTNLTARQHFKHQGDPLKLFLQLLEKQPVEYAVFTQTEQQSYLSISPELFFKKQNTTLLTKPMKGTRSRSKDSKQDQINYEFLKHDAKNHSENLIIVDLLRNDLSKIANPNTLQVTQLCEVERYPSVFQMTSSIRAQVSKNISAYTLLKNLFPCGSITGAPKSSTLSLIHHCEKSSRGIYTGSIGYILPNNDMCFNVCIRTLSLNHKNKRGTLGLGGGITITSKLQEEWDEMLLKGNFAYQTNHHFNLIETFLLEKSSDSNNTMTASLNQHHKNRLQHAARSLKHPKYQLPFESQQLPQSPQHNASKAPQKQSFHFTPHNPESPIITTTPLSLTNKRLRIRISDALIDSNNKLFQYKTTHPSTRGFFNDQRQKALQEGFDDYLFLTIHGELTESTIANLILEINGSRYTPPIHVGVLPGTFRAHLIQTQQVRVKKLYLSDLLKAEQIWLVNAVRKWQPCELIRPDHDFTH